MSYGEVAVIGVLLGRTVAFAVGRAGAALLLPRWGQDGRSAGALVMLVTLVAGRRGR